MQLGWGEGRRLWGCYAGTEAPVGQGGWGLTAPTPGVPRYGGPSSAAHLLSLGLCPAHSLATCPGVVCCPALLFAVWVSQGTTGQDSESLPGPGPGGRCSVTERTTERPGSRCSHLGPSSSLGGLGHAVRSTGGP